MPRRNRHQQGEQLIERLYVTLVSHLESQGRVRLANPSKKRKQEVDDGGLAGSHPHGPPGHLRLSGDILLQSPRALQDARGLRGQPRSRRRQPLSGVFPAGKINGPGRDAECTLTRYTACRYIDVGGDSGLFQRRRGDVLSTGPTRPGREMVWCGESRGPQARPAGLRSSAVGPRLSTGESPRTAEGKLTWLP